MASPQNGDKVKFNYTGKLDDGTVFDTSDPSNPLEFIVGSKTIIPGLEKELVEMESGETKTVKIESKDAYGAYQDGLAFEVARDKFPEGAKLELGKPVSVKKADDSDVVMWIKSVADESVTLDANHPLAGKDLTFEVELVGIESGAEGTDSE